MIKFGRALEALQSQAMPNSKHHKWMLSNRNLRYREHLITNTTHSIENCWFNKQRHIISGRKWIHKIPNKRTNECSLTNFKWSNIFCDQATVWRWFCKRLLWKWKVHTLRFWYKFFYGLSSTEMVMYCPKLSQRPEVYMSEYQFSKHQKIKLNTW